MINLRLRSFVILVLLGANIAFAKPSSDMVKIKGGEFSPFFDKDKDGKKFKVVVSGFYMDQTSVTNEDYLSFVKANPEWRKTKVKSIFADQSYLKHWSGDLGLPKDGAKQPVRYVSWFAATEYCQWLGKSLPTILQWEYVASADEKSPMAINKESYKQRILKWYSRPNRDPIPDVKKGPKNFWGVYDLHGLIWEWNKDYNTALVTGESREDSTLNRNRFCGSGSLGAKDKLDYGAFMRFGFRSSLKGNYTVANLGFRCVKE